MSVDSSPTLEPVVVRPDPACQMLGIRRNTLYKLINSRELDSFTEGNARFITTESIYRYVARRLAEDGKPSSRSFEKAAAASVASRKRARAEA